MDLRTDTFDLSESFERISAGWIGITLLGVIGVLIGLVFSLFFPPRYEAASSFAISVTYGVTETLELVTEDRALDRVWQLAMSEDTLQDTISLLEVSSGQNPAWESITALKDHIRLDTRLSRWELIGIHRDPFVASNIANAWKTVTLDYLDEALDHAWSAYSLEGVVFDVECVKLLAEDVPQQRLWTCINTGPGVSPEVVERFMSELEASRGILPIFSYEALDMATVPETPALWSRGLMAFFGGLIGLSTGIILALLRPALFFLNRRSNKSDSERSGSSLN